MTATDLTPADKARRAKAMRMWRRTNPRVLRIAGGLGRWWVVLETKGHRSGEPRRVPLARGPVENHTAWLIAVHGRHASYVKNIEASPQVRLKLRGRWHEGVAVIEPLDEGMLERFNRYA